MGGSTRGGGEARGGVRGPSLAVTALQSAALAAAGEVLAGGRRPHRLGSLALFAAVFTGPSSFYFYRAVDRWARARGRGGPRAALAACVALDQLLFAPLCLAAFTAYAHLALEGRRFAALPDAIRLRLAAALPRLWPAWVPLSALGFLTVGPAHRPLANNLAGLAVAAALGRRARPRTSEPGAGRAPTKAEAEAALPAPAASPRKAGVAPLDPGKLADDPWLKHATPTTSPR